MSLENLMAERPLPAYDGDEPYVFVTYAHEDTALVHPHIRWLQDQGFKVWWDEGISPGAVWRAEIARAIRRCSVLVYFVTPASVIAEHCTREVNLAIDEYHRPVLAVHLSETRLPDTLALSLTDRQAILEHALAPGDYERKLSSAVATYLGQPAPAVVEPIAVRRTSRAPAWLLLFMGVLLGVVAAATAMWTIVTPVSTSTPPPARFSIDLPAGIRIPDIATHPMALSDDGRLIVFAGESESGSQIYQRRLDSLEPTPIPGTQGAAGAVSSLYLTPDDQSLMFYDFNEDDLKRVSIEGGPARSILTDQRGFNGISLGRDGTLYLTRSSGPILRASDPNSTPEPVTGLEPGTRHVHPHLLDDGKSLLFAVVAEDDPSVGRIMALSLDGGAQKELIEGLMPQVTSTGHLLFAKGDSIWAAPFDAKLLELTGRAAPVLNDVEISVNYASQFSFSNRGSMIYIPKSRGHDRLVWVDLSGREISELLLSVPPATLGQPRISPDGRNALIRIERPGEARLWVYTLERGSLTKLDDTAITSLWSADGRRVIYSKLGPNGVTLVQRNADGTGEEQVLVDNERDQHPTSQSHDGAVVFYYECTNLATECDIGCVMSSDPASAELLLQTNSMERHPALSPDQRWLAYESNESGRYEVYVRPYPDLESARWQVSTEGGSRPIWSPDGGALYYSEGGGISRRMMAVEISGEEQLVASVPKPLFKFKSRYLSRIIRNHDLHPDGDRFLIAMPEDRQPQRVIYVQNWLSEVERLVPRS